MIEVEGEVEVGSGSWGVRETSQTPQTQRQEAVVCRAHAVFKFTALSV